MTGRVTNVVISGLGGQGVLTASDILAEAAFLAGLDVKKAEVHGMSRRGGSVTADVRFGPRVYSPVVPPGEADFLIVLDQEQVERNRSLPGDGGVLIGPEAVDPESLPGRKCLNVALLGVLSRYLEINGDAWHEAIRSKLKPELHEANRQAFELGRASGRAQ